MSSKNREKQSCGVWHDDGTLGPGCSLNVARVGCTSESVKIVGYPYLLIFS